MWTLTKKPVQFGSDPSEQECVAHDIFVNDKYGATLFYERVFIDEPQDVINKLEWVVASLNACDGIADPQPHELLKLRDLQEVTARSANALRSTKVRAALESLGTK